MSTKARRWLRRTALALGLVAAPPLGWAGYLRLSGNFHVVEDDVLYRSGQLSGVAFRDKIEKHGIRTIINLRGENASQDWHADEMRAVTLTGVAHIDLAISANNELADEQIERLTAALRDSPRPILVHCEAGADRSGLASALYQLTDAKRPEAEASSQLSFRYGHFPWLASSTGAMDRTFERVSRRLVPR